MNYTFEHEEAGAKGTFSLINEDKIVARMTYSRLDSNNIIVDHTAVDPNSKGEGHGKAIVEQLVLRARGNDQKVMPLCPFAKGVIEKNSDWHDILRK